MPLTVAFSALGIGKSAGRAASERGELPFRVIRVGRRLRVPTAELARLLGLDDHIPRAS